MSDQNKDRLTDFLDNSESKDAFEKEALEGFESIASKEEIKELKKKTDSKAEVLFQKKAIKPLVWAAAAVLLITFGLLIKLFLPTNELIKSNDLALHEKPATGGEEIKANEPISETTVETKNLEQVIEKKPLSRVEGKKDEIVTQKQAPLESPPAKLAEVKEDPKSMKDVEAEDLSADIAAVDNNKSETMTGGAVANNTSSIRELSDKVVLAKESKRKEKSSKKSNAEAEVKNAPASPGVAKPEEDLRETESNLFYLGGDKALISDLREKLKLIELNLPFDALITITDEKKITAVEFVDERDLSKDELKQIKNELKTLEKFNFKVTPAKKTKFTYRIIYRP